MQVYPVSAVPRGPVSSKARRRRTPVLFWAGPKRILKSDVLRFAAANNLPTESRHYLISKRLLDLSICLLLLPLLATLLLGSSVFVMLVSGYPVIYRQQRAGRYGRPFSIYKFRTMRNGSAKLLAEWLAQHPEARREWQHTHKLKQDPRISRGGRFLRRTSLDELPQLLNVLRGEMSLVGPRPVV